MPLFFFLSGLLSRSATAEPARAFALRMATRIVHPYLLWGAVILALHHAMSDFTNTRVDSLDLTKLLYRPPAVLWFLYVLFACFLLARTLRGLPTAPRLTLGAALCLAGCLLDAWLLPYLRFVGIFIDRHRARSRPASGPAPPTAASLRSRVSGSPAASPSPSPPPRSRCKATPPPAFATSLRPPEASSSSSPPHAPWPPAPARRGSSRISASAPCRSS